MIIQDFSPFQFIEPVIYRGHKSKIIDIIILTPSCFISLDISGTVMLWEVRGNDTVHSQLYSKVYSPQKSREDFTCISEISHESFMSISAIKDSRTKTYVYMGLSIDEVWIYEFGDERNGSTISKPYLKKLRIIPHIPITHISRIYNFTLFNNNEYLLLINQRGELNVRYMDDESEVTFNSTNDIYNYGKLINIHKCYKTYSSAVFVIVFERNIIKIAFRPVQNKARILNFQHSEVNFNSTVFSDSLHINCSHFMEKRNCLILGTQNGFKILDIDKEFELYREHVSDSIISIDSLMLQENGRRRTELNDEFIISSCTEKSKEIIYVYKMTIPTMDNNTGMSYDGGLDSKQIVMVEGGNVEWFAGGKLYDIYLDESDNFTLYAVDSNKLVSFILFYF